jgi:DNA polymerase-3 subunit beta
MKLTIDIKTLLAAINRAKPVASGRVSLPALSCFLLTADESLTIAATDCDLFVSTEAVCTVAEKGSVCISAGRFASAIGALGSGEVEITADAKNNLAITQGLRRFVLHGLKSEEFPACPVADDAPSFTTAAAPFGAALSRCAPFASVEPTRYVLCGVAMQGDKKKGQVNFISTDGKCLRTHRIEQEPPDDADIIIPSKAVALLASLIDGRDDAEASLRVSYTDSLLRVEAARWAVVTKLIEGNYPNWRQVIPEKSKLSAIAPKEAWLDALQLVGVTAQSDKDNDPKAKLTAAKREVHMESTCPDVGNSSIPVDGATASGEAFITLSCRYLKVAISSFDDGEIRLQLTDEISPLKIEDANGLFVVMPFRTA